MIRVEHITDADLQKADEIRRELKKIFVKKLELMPVALVEFIAKKAGVNRFKLEREVVDNYFPTYLVLASRIADENPHMLIELYANCRELAAKQL
jgi:hypothetical protein